MTYFLFLDSIKFILTSCMYIYIVRLQQTWSQGTFQDMTILYLLYRHLPIILRSRPPYVKGLEILYVVIWRYTNKIACFTILYFFWLNAVTFLFLWWHFISYHTDIELKPHEESRLYLVEKWQLIHKSVDRH